MPDWMPSGRREAIRVRPICSVLVLALALAMLFGNLAHAAAALEGTAVDKDYPINARRSNAEFQLRLLWFKQIGGSFDRVAGELRLNRPQGTAVVQASLAVDSIRMASPRLRAWVLAPEFFDAAQYPTIHFASDPFAVNLLREGGHLSGQLRMRGVLRPVHFELAPSACTLRVPDQCVLRLHGAIERSDFGMRGHRATLSDQVELSLLVTLESPPR